MDISPAFLIPLVFAIFCLIVVFAVGSYVLHQMTNSVTTLNSRLDEIEQLLEELEEEEGEELEEELEEYETI